MGVEKLIVETDASLSAPVDHETTFGNMIEAYRSILQVKSDFKVIWVRRNANFVAYSLARMSHNFKSPFYWDSLQNLWTVFWILVACARDRTFV